jgi:hypothetical protein
MLPSYRGASLLGSLIPANSKTVRRSRQLPRSAPSIAARTRSISFSCKARSGLFRSFGAGLFAGFVPRLTPWAALFRRSAAGSVVKLSWDAFTCAGCGSAFGSRWARAFEATRAGAPALRTINLLLGNGDGTFRSPIAIDAGGCFGAIPDLNGDKKLDIVLVGCSTAGTDGDITVLLGNGDGTFKKPVNYPAGASGLLKVRDVNGDGKLDVVVPDTRDGGNKVAVLLGNGDGTFQAPHDYFVDNDAYGVAVGDFNGDNLPDLAVGNNDHVSILLNTGR